MNELEYMCAEVPPPSADALAQGHERLVAEMRGTISSAGRARAGRGARWKRRPFAGVLLAAGAVAAVAAVAAALVSGTASEPTVSLRPASAVEILGRAADTARAEDLHARNDQFIKVTSVEIVSGRRTERQLWESVDGSRVGLLRTSPCPFRSGMATCDTRLENGDRPKGAPPTPFEGTPAFLRTLPTDPAALQAYIRAHIDEDALAAGKTTVEEDTWSFVVDHIGENYVPPKLRGALYEVAARLPRHQRVEERPRCDRTSRRRDHKEHRTRPRRADLRPGRLPAPRRAAERHVRGKSGLPERGGRDRSGRHAPSAPLPP